MPHCKILLMSALNLAVYKELLGNPMVTPKGTKHSLDICSTARLDLKLTVSYYNYIYVSTLN